MAANPHNHVAKIARAVQSRASGAEGIKGHMPGLIGTKECAIAAEARTM